MTRHCFILMLIFMLSVAGAACATKSATTIVYSAGENSELPVYFEVRMRVDYGETHYGIMDEAGRLVVPLGEYRVRDTFLHEDGQTYFFFAELRDGNIVQVVTSGGHVYKGDLCSYDELEDAPPNGCSRHLPLRSTYDYLKGHLIVSPVTKPYVRLETACSEWWNDWGGDEIREGCRWGRMAVLDLEGHPIVKAFHKDATGMCFDSEVTIYDEPEYIAAGGPFIVVTNGWHWDVDAESCEPLEMHSLDGGAASVVTEGVGENGEGVRVADAGNTKLEEAGGGEERSENGAEFGEEEDESRDEDDDEEEEDYGWGRLRGEMWCEAGELTYCGDARERCAAGEVGYCEDDEAEGYCEEGKLMYCEEAEKFCDEGDRRYCVSAVAAQHCEGGDRRYCDVSDARKRCASGDKRFCEGVNQEPYHWNAQARCHDGERVFCARDIAQARCGAGDRRFCDEGEAQARCSEGDARYCETTARLYHHWNAQEQCDAGERKYCDPEAAIVRCDAGDKRFCEDDVAFERCLGGDQRFCKPPLGYCEIVSLRTGKRIHDVDLTVCEPMNPELIAVSTFQSRLKWGFMDLKGTMVVPAQFTRASYEGGAARVALSKMDAQELCGTTEGSSRLNASDAPVCQSIEGKALFASTDVIEGTVDILTGAIKWDEPNIRVKMEDPLNRFNFYPYRLITEGLRKYEEHIVFIRKYASALEFHQGRARVCPDKCGFIDLQGNEIVPPKYEYVSDFKEGRAGVGLNGVWGYIDLQGNEVIPLQYDMRYGAAKDFEGGLAKVSRGGKTGYIDPQGNEIVPLQYNEVGMFREGRMLVIRNGLHGFVDLQGKEVVPPRYEYARHFREGRALVKHQGYYGHIDLEGNEVIPLQYGGVSEVERGWAVYEDMADDVRVYSDMAMGGVGPDPRFVRAEEFQNGNAILHLSSEQIKAICEDSAHPVHHRKTEFSAACSEMGGKSVNRMGAVVMMDPQGVPLSRFDYQYRGRLNPELTVMQSKNSLVVLDALGREIVLPRFMEIKQQNKLGFLLGGGETDPGGEFILHSGDIVTRTTCLYRNESSLIEPVDCLLLKNGEKMVWDRASKALKHLPPPAGDKRWVEDPNLGGFGLQDTEQQWLVPYRLRMEPSLGEHGLSMAKVVTSREGPLFDAIWLNASGEIIWPMGWSDPCAVTGGNVVWPDGACLSNDDNSEH